MACGGAGVARAAAGAEEHALGRVHALTLFNAGEDRCRIVPVNPRGVSWRAGAWPNARTAALNILPTLMSTALLW